MSTTGFVPLEDMPTPLEVRVDNTYSTPLYFVGEWSFDDEERNLEYIDEALAAFTAWRTWVVANGEVKQ